MKRHEARISAVQALYAADVGKEEPESAVRHVLDEVYGVTDGDRAYVERLVTGTRGLVTDIDACLESRVEGWRLDRIAKVELNILRLALFEVLRERDVDFGTIVDEAVELAKDFGNEASGKFVNGVLAKIGPGLRETGL